MNKHCLRMQKLLLSFMIFCTTFKDIWCLRNVQLSIRPRIVERRHHSVLHCDYDLEGGQLYTVKWYRGLHEFYRFTATEAPHTKVFPYAGISVNVNHSNSTQVQLENIEFNLSGNFSCEVTTDNPMLVGTDIQSMLVVQLPSQPPTISVGHEPLDYGHVLQANCSLPPSKPQGVLKFLLNNLTVARTEPSSRKVASEPEWTDLMLKLPLTEFHFSGGRLILSCVAQVADANVYQRIATLELQSAREPVPEKVSAVNSVSCHSTYFVILCQAIPIFYFVNV